ncbi:YfiR family protein [Marinilabilia sp.]|uniref:YfiR family protein n=1 Tax=Marinilabilia sp. TaxID=2021252 RepID=UPI0025BBDE02|nr:YfiR family protein [Marinilabilia sp.]
MRKFYLMLALLITMPVLMQGQVAKYKAVFTLNFIRYIGWPEAARQGDFVIGVLQDSDIARRISQQTGGKKFGFQDVVVKEFNSLEEVTDCQVLFISDSFSLSRNATQIKQKLGNNSLIVTESEGATEYGAMINFVVRNEVLKFEIHKGNASGNGLQISSRLENMSSAIVL